MATVTIHEAQATLAELIHSLKPGEEFVITENDRPVAKLVAEKGPDRKVRRRGSAKGKLLIETEDDEHLKDFKEYLQ